MVSLSAPEFRFKLACLDASPNPLIEHHTRLPSQSRTPNFEMIKSHVPQQKNYRGLWLGLELFKLNNDPNISQRKTSAIPTSQTRFRNSKFLTYVNPFLTGYLTLARPKVGKLKGDARYSNQRNICALPLKSFNRLVQVFQLKVHQSSHIGIRQLCTKNAERT